MQKNSYTSKIQQHQLDATHLASLPSLILSVVGTAGLDADSKGFGIASLGAANRSWVLLKFAMELTRRPTLGEEITNTTWIEGVSRISTTRNFSLTDNKGEALGQAASQWCMIELNSRRPVDLSSTELGFKEHVIDDRLTIKPPRRLAAVEQECCAERTVQYSDIDFNRHMNAIRYIEFMLDQLPAEWLEHRGGVRVDLNFVSECYLGETIAIKYEQQDNISLFEIVKSSGEIAARGSFEWR